MTEQWRELKVTITEMRDNDGTGTQQEVCKFLANLMETLEKQMQEPCEDCIRRSDVVQWLERCTDDSIEYAIDSNLEFIPPVTPSNADTREAYIKGYDYGVKDWFKSKTQPSEDCISREAALDIINHILNFNGFNSDELLCLAYYRINELPSVTPSYNSIKTELKSCEDSISRQAVIDYAKDTCADLDKDEDTEIFCDEIKAMPSVTPQRPRGKWIKCKSRVGVYFKCSECGKKLNWIDRDDNYCNNCGSDNSESTKEWFKEWDTNIAEMSGGGEDADSN